MLLQWFFDLLFPDYVQQQEETEMEISQGIEEYMERVDFQIPNWLKVLFWTALATVAVMVLYFLIRLLATPKQNAASAAKAASASSSFVDSKTKKRLNETKMRLAERKRRLRIPSSDIDDFYTSDIDDFYV
jgi:flagellar biosynthesis/type III secretory pathway M-ring protein FliF/YscJ